MLKKSLVPFRFIFWALVLVVAGLLLWFYPPNKREGLSAPQQDFSTFTGLVFFTKTKNCDEACIDFNKTVIKMYEKFPNNIGVVNCTEPSAVSETLTKYKVDGTKVPKILTFKNGVADPYNKLTDYDSLENYLLSIMKTVRPPKSSYHTVAKLAEASS